MSNPGPVSTATQGMNEPGTPLETWVQEQLDDVRPAERERVSKHRAGRTKALPKKVKARNKARAIRANRQAAMDAKALREALGE